MAAPPVNALSFDVEEYFHALNFRSVVQGRHDSPLKSRVEIGTRRILEALEDHRSRATFFILGAVAEEHPRLVGEIAAAGHEIASHGISHRTVQDLGAEGFRKEAAISRKLLQDLSGQTVDGFRASTFSITRDTLWALDILEEEGYRYDSSIFPVLHDRYGIPDFPRTPVCVQGKAGRSLIEFPLLTWRVAGINLPVGGGGYFRIFPYCLTRHAVRRMNAADHPAIIYLHPWEFDPDQPRHSLGGLKTFRHYFNISRTGARLKKLLQGFSFGTIGDLARLTASWPEWKGGSAE